MKKEYKTPIICVANMEIESLMLGASDQGNIMNSKQTGRIYEDEEAAPAAPKKFWDDEE